MSSDGPVASDGPDPGKLQIPKTVVEKVEPESPSYGEVPGTAAHEMRKADAEPDEVLKAPDATRAKLEGQSQDHSQSGSPTSSPSRPVPTGEEHIAVSGYTSSTRSEELAEGFEEKTAEPENELNGEDQMKRGAEETSSETAAEGFGDDFDDFEEGGEDDEFGAFDEAEVADTDASELQSVGLEATLPETIVHKEPIVSFSPW